MFLFIIRVVNTSFNRVMRIIYNNILCRYTLNDVKRDGRNKSSTSILLNPYYIVCGILYIVHIVCARVLKYRVYVCACARLFDIRRRRLLFYIIILYNNILIYNYNVHNAAHLNFDCHIRIASANPMTCVESFGCGQCRIYTLCYITIYICIYLYRNYMKRGSSFRGGGDEEIDWFQNS